MRSLREESCTTTSPLSTCRELSSRRFVSYPSEHALVAHALWIGHTHMIDRFDTTPRLAFMSAEKEFRQDAGA